MRALLAMLILLPPLTALPASAQPALAQVAAPAAARLAAPAPVPPALTPAEAQAVLDVLNDPARRAAFTATLQTFLKATHAAAPPVVAVPLTPGSVGAQVVAQSATWLSDAMGQVTALQKLLGNLPAAWAFVTRVGSDPDMRDDLFHSFGGLALVLIGALLLELVVDRLLRRPTRWLAAMAQGPADAEALADPPLTRAARRARSLANLLRALRRLPWALLRLGLDMGRLGLFLALAYAGLGLARPDTLDVLTIGIRVYAICRAVVIAARFLLTPTYPTLRLIPVRDRVASYALRWVTRLAVLVGTAVVTVQVAGLYDMPATAVEALIKLYSLIGHVLLMIMVLQCRRPVARAIHAAPVSTAWMATLRDILARRWHWPTLFLVAASWVVWAARLRHGLEHLAWGTAETIAVALALRFAGTLLVAALERGLGVPADDRPASRTGRYLVMLRRLAFSFLTTIGTVAVLEIWGVHALGWFTRGLGGQLAGAGGVILFTGIGSLVAWEAANAALERELDRLTHATLAARAARLRTLMPILRTSLLVALMAVFVLVTLSEIGVDVAPLLAGAGILGVAIGFGSQKLVQDFITGIFLLLENAMQVGDWVTVAGFSGTVEALSIRTLKLRGTDGAVHVIPFSAVTTVSNSHRGIGNVQVSITIDAACDTDHVSDVLASIAQEMRAERRFADMMRGGFQLYGVDRLEAGTATISGQISCTDTGRLPVQREFNRRLNIRLRDEGLRLMAPVQTSITLPPPADAASGDAAPGGTASGGAGPGNPAQGNPAQGALAQGTPAQGMPAQGSPAQGQAS